MIVQFKENESWFIIQQLKGGFVKDQDIFKLFMNKSFENR